MSNSIELYKDLPSDTSTFFVDVVGNVTGVRYQGEFKCKIPSVRTHLDIDKYRATLSGNMAEYLQPSTLIMYRMLAYLRFTLIKSPEFWEQSDSGTDLRDSNIIEAIFDKVLELEGKWLDEAYPARNKDKDEQS